MILTRCYRNPEVNCNTQLSTAPEHLLFSSLCEQRMAEADNKMIDTQKEVSKMQSSQTLLPRSWGRDTEQGKEELNCVDQLEHNSHASISESSEVIQTVKSNNLRNRDDVKNKSAIRLVRTHYRRLFKTQHKKIVKQRIVNCKLNVMFANMKRFLCQILSEDKVDNDLVYYLIGILTFKPVHMLPVSKEIKGEVNDFLTCVRGYSMKKFNQALKSKSLLVLWEHLLWTGTYEEELANLRRFCEPAVC